MPVESVRGLAVDECKQRTWNGSTVWEDGRPLFILHTRMMVYSQKRIPVPFSCPPQSIPDGYGNELEATLDSGGL